MKRTAGIAASIVLLTGLAIAGCQKDATMGQNGEGSMNNKNNGNNNNNNNNNNGNNGNNGGGQNGGGSSGSNNCNTCFYSQGYWFASGKHMWPDMNGSTTYGSVTVGGHHYTMEEGMHIWKTSNKGGKKDAKKAFILIIVIKLSNYCGSYSDYPSGSGHMGGHTGFMTDMATVENWLSMMGGKLSTSHMPHTSMPSHVKQAYERLKSWIEMHECDDDSDEHDD